MSDPPPKGISSDRVIAQAFVISLIPTADPPEPPAPQRKKVRNLSGTACTWSGAYYFRWDENGAYFFHEDFEHSLPKSRIRMVALARDGYNLTNSHHVGEGQRKEQWQVLSVELL